MNVLVLHGSPKKKGGASRCFARVLGWMSPGARFEGYSVRDAREAGAALDRLSGDDVDAVILSVPLYVDGIPSHMLPFLKEAERRCREGGCRFKLYVISNSGFIEGRQNRHHLAQYRCWCERAGATWGGGVGIGGGVMLYVLYFLLFLDVIQAALAGLGAAALGPAAMAKAGALSFAQSLVWLVFFSAGMLVCLWLLARDVGAGRVGKERYTRALLPGPLFLVCADIFMFLSALVRGRFVFALLGEDKQSAAE